MKPVGPVCHRRRAQYPSRRNELPVANAVVTLTPAHGMDTRLTPAQRRGAAAAKPVLRTDQQGNLTPRVLIVRPGQEIGLEHEQDPAPMVRSRPYDQPFFLA
jgi:hypothetical protein